MAGENRDIRKLLTLPPAALKALAREWFLRGFRMSGYRAHGETRLADSAAFTSLLEVEFERVWGDVKDGRIPVPIGANLATEGSKPRRREPDGTPPPRARRPR